MKIDDRIYEPPKSNIAIKSEIKRLGVMKFLLLLYVLAGFVEGFLLFDFEFEQLVFVIGFFGLTVLLAWLVWREIHTKPEKSYWLPFLISCITTVGLYFDVSDSESIIVIDVILVISEVFVMVVIGSILLVNSSELRV